MIKISVINVSDRASAGHYEDTPGQAAVALLREWLVTPFELDYRVVPDGPPVIEAELRRMADEAGCGLVVTTGGTGPAVATLAAAVPTSAAKSSHFCKSVRRR